MFKRVYFTRKRAKFKAINGEKVNIPYGTKVVAINDKILMYNNRPLTCIDGKNGMDFFVLDDGVGEKRAELVNSILNRQESSKNRNENIKRLSNDSIASSYRREDLSDAWLWKRSFYDAPIFVLEHINKLVK